MPSAVRTVTQRALRDAAQFVITEEILLGHLTATPELLRDPQRLAPLEAAIRATLAEGAPLPANIRSSAVPVLGNIAEAIIESTLADLGWQPVYDDDRGFSSGHGIDLLMLDPTLERLVAIEVKSTIQPRRWPRLARGRSEQLTPEWLDGPRNTGMLDSAVSSADVYMMVAQIHLGRRRWRCCLAGGPSQSQPVTEEGQLMNLDWVAPNST